MAIPEKSELIVTNMAFATAVFQNKNWLAHCCCCNYRSPRTALSHAEGRCWAPLAAPEGRSECDPNAVQIALLDPLAVGACCQNASWLNRGLGLKETQGTPAETQQHVPS